MRREERPERKQRLVDLREEKGGGWPSAHRHGRGSCCDSRGDRMRVALGREEGGALARREARRDS